MNPDIASIQHRYRFTRDRLRLAALLMAVFIIAVIWPAFELCRLVLSGDTEAFSPARALIAGIIATGFFFYANWQMQRLTGNSSRAETGDTQ